MVQLQRFLFASADNNRKWWKEAGFQEQEHFLLSVFSLAYLVVVEHMHAWGSSVHFFKKF